MEAQVNEAIIRRALYKKPCKFNVLLFKIPIKIAEDCFLKIKIADFFTNYTNRKKTGFLRGMKRQHIFILIVLQLS